MKADKSEAVALTGKEVAVTPTGWESEMAAIVVGQVQAVSVSKHDYEVVLFVPYSITVTGGIF